MQQYSFTTTWFFNAPLQNIWELIKHAEKWPQWWKGVVAVETLVEGDKDGLGKKQLQQWKSFLPYIITFDVEIISIVEKKTIIAKANGDLVGKGTWLFEEKQGQVKVVYTWEVTTSKKWMNVSAPILKPVFRFNHNVVMSWGEKGMRKQLGLL